jgi:hypothetical protein
LDRPVSHDRGEHPALVVGEGRVCRHAARIVLWPGGSPNLLPGRVEGDGRDFVILQLSLRDPCHLLDRQGRNRRDDNARMGVTVTE